MTSQVQMERDLPASVERVWEAWRRVLDDFEAFLAGRPLPYPWDAED